MKTNNNPTANTVNEDLKNLCKFLDSINYSQRMSNTSDIYSQLFFQSRRVNTNSQPSAITELTPFVENGLLVIEHNDIYSTVHVIHYRNSYYVVDSPLLSQRGIEVEKKIRDDYYYYIGTDGMMLFDYVYPKLSKVKYKNALDLCTGSGIIGITLSSYCENIYGVDLDEGAYKWANVNRHLNRSENYKPYHGDLYEPVFEKGPFDIILANPPYSIFPPKYMEKCHIKDFEVSKDYGLGVTLKIIHGFEKNLAQNGIAYICVSVPILKGKDYLLHRLKEEFHSANYSITVYYDHRHGIEKFKQFYKGLGISGFNFVFITVERGVTFKISKKFSRYYYLSFLTVLSKLLPENFKNVIKKIFFGFPVAGERMFKQKRKKYDK